jgi:transcription termination factor Rho
MFSQMVTAPPNGAGQDLVNATEAIIDSMRRTENNQEFLESLVEQN